LILNLLRINKKLNEQSKDVKISYANIDNDIAPRLDNELKQAIELNYEMTIATKRSF